MRKRARFDERAQNMRDKYTARANKHGFVGPERNQLERAQAFVYGFEAGKEATAGNPGKQPFTDRALQKAWRRGYATGKKAIKVKLKLP